MRQRGFEIATLLAMIAVASGDMSADAAPPVDTSPGGPDYHIPEAVRRTADRALVFLSGPPHMGSGVLLSSTVVLTNWHVVRGVMEVGSDQVRVDRKPSSSNVTPNATVTLVGPQLDLALLRLSKSSSGPAVAVSDRFTGDIMRETRERLGMKRQGIRIYPVGYTARHETRGPTAFPELFIDTGEIAGTRPWDIGAFIADTSEKKFPGKVSQLIARLGPTRVRPSDDGCVGRVPVFTINAWTTSGQSGGPCLSEDGDLLAVNHVSEWDGKTQVYALSIPAELVRLFLVGVDDSGVLVRPVFDKFHALGGSGKVGLPYARTDNMFVHAWGQGRVQTMKDAKGNTGAIMLKEGAKAAYWVRGAIWEYYASNGGPKQFGYPKADEKATKTGSEQEFELATLVWDKRTNTVSVKPLGGDMVANYSPYYDPSANRICFASRQGEQGPVSIWIADEWGRKPVKVYDLPAHQELVHLGVWRGRPLLVVLSSGECAIEMVEPSGGTKVLLRRPEPFELGQVVLRPDREPWLLFFSGGAVIPFWPSAKRTAATHDGGAWDALWTPLVENRRPMLVRTDSGGSVKVAVKHPTCLNADWQNWTWTDDEGCSLQTGDDELMLISSGEELWAGRLQATCDRQGRPSGAWLEDGPKRLTRRDKQGRIIGVIIASGYVAYCDAAGPDHRDIYRVDLRTGDWARVTYGADRMKTEKVIEREKLERAAISYAKEALGLDALERRIRDILRIPLPPH